MAGVTWFFDGPPFPGPGPWEYSNNSGGSYVPYTGGNRPQVASSPNGTQRFRQNVTVPPGVTEEYLIVTFSGDLYDNTVNNRPQLRVDGVLVAATDLPGGTVAIPMSMLPAGVHSIEIWVGQSSANAGVTRLDAVSGAFPVVRGSNPSINNLPSASCRCCSRGGIDRCYYDGSALRVATFHDNVVTANPNNFGISGIPNSRDGSYSGLAATLVQVPADGSTSGIEFDFFYYFPRDRVVSVRITTNYGNILNDGDNILNPTAQLFDENNVALTAPFVAAAANGGAFFVTPVPGGPLNGVSRLHLSDIKGNVGNPVTVGIREVELLVEGIGPASLVYCPQESGAARLSWVDPRTGAAVSAADLTDCR